MFGFHISSLLYLSTCSYLDRQGGIAFFVGLLSNLNGRKQYDQKVSRLKQLGALWKLYVSNTWIRAIGWDQKLEWQVRRH